MTAVVTLPGGERYELRGGAGFAPPVVLDHPATRELIGRSAAEARAVGGRIAAGVGTDNPPPGPASLAAVARAYFTVAGVPQ